MRNVDHDSSNAQPVVGDLRGERVSATVSRRRCGLALRFIDDDHARGGNDCIDGRNGDVAAPPRSAHHERFHPLRVD